MLVKIDGFNFCSLKSVPIITVSSKGLISRMLSTIFIFYYFIPDLSELHFMLAISLTTGLNFSSL